MSSSMRKIWSNDPFARLREEDRNLIRAIQSQRLTYLSPTRLVSILTSCREIEARHLPGMMIEAGCALGGSTILIARTKNPTRPLVVYDVFGMIPAPTQADGSDVQARYEAISAGKSEGIEGDRYYGYEEDLLEKVQQNLLRYGVSLEHQVTLVQGLVQDMLRVQEPVAFAHIDVDWYEPVKTCLEQIIPHLVIGGIVIVDDYHDWTGCYKATTEYFHNFSKQFTLDDSAGSLKITRTH